MSSRPPQRRIVLTKLTERGRSRAKSADSRSAKEEYPTPAPWVKPRARSHQKEQGEGREALGARKRRLSKAQDKKDKRPRAQRSEVKRPPEPADPPAKQKKRAATMSGTKEGCSDAEHRDTPWENRISVPQQNSKDGEPMIRIGLGQYKFEDSKTEQDGRWLGILDIKQREWPQSTSHAIMTEAEQDSTFGGKYYAFTEDVRKYLGAWSTQRNLINIYGKHMIMCKKCGGNGHSQNTCQNEPGDNVGSIFDPNTVCAQQAVVLNKYHPELIGPWINQKGKSLRDKLQNKKLFMGQKIPTPDSLKIDFKNEASVLYVKPWNSQGAGTLAPPERGTYEAPSPHSWTGGGGKSGSATDGSKGGGRGYQKSQSYQGSWGSGKMNWSEPVSYTHLTLPTILLV